jgi:hypothetical protein
MDKLIVIGLIYIMYQAAEKIIKNIMFCCYQKMSSCVTHTVHLGTKKLLLIRCNYQRSADFLSVTQILESHCPNYNVF